MTDAATGEVLGLEALAERDSDGFTDRLRDFVSEYGIEAMVTDDLNTYKPVVRRLGLGQVDNMEAADGFSLRRGLGASAS